MELATRRALSTPRMTSSVPAVAVRISDRRLGCAIKPLGATTETAMAKRRDVAAAKRIEVPSGSVPRLTISWPLANGPGRLSAVPFLLDLLEIGALRNDMLAGIVDRAAPAPRHAHLRQFRLQRALP